MAAIPPMIRGLLEAVVIQLHQDGERNEYTHHLEKGDVRIGHAPFTNRGNRGLLEIVVGSRVYLICDKSETVFRPDGEILLGSQALCMARRNLSSWPPRTSMTEKLEREKAAAVVEETAEEKEHAFLDSVDEELDAEEATPAPVEEPVVKGGVYGVLMRFRKLDKAFDDLTEYVESIRGSMSDKEAGTAERKNERYFWVELPDDSVDEMRAWGRCRELVDEPA